MPAFSPLRRRLNRALAPTLAFAAIIYFGYHTLHGNYGLLALREVEREIGALTPKAEALAQQREALEAKVALLRPDAIDPDMLDQRAREILGFVHPDDVVIYTAR